MTAQFGGQLIAENLFELGNFGCDKRPKNADRYALIAMPQDVADVSHLTPGNFRMLGLQVVAEAAARRGDDLGAALNQSSFLPVAFEDIERRAREQSTQAFASFDDIGRARDRRTVGHRQSPQNTRTADCSMRARRT